MPPHACHSKMPMPRALLDVSRRSVAACLATLWASACGRDGADCLALPCAVPFAVQVTVTAAGSGAPVPGAFVAVAGPVSGQGACAQAAVGTQCAVAGGAGTYELDVGAPGYRTVHRQVVVAGTAPPCGCPSAETQHVDVALLPAA